MYGAHTTCCDLAKATCTSRIVALKALLAKQTNGEKLSTLSDLKAMVGARYQLEPAAATARTMCCNLAMASLQADRGSQGTNGEADL